MPGKNASDVAKYEKLHWLLYLAQLTLEDVSEELATLTSCPKGHPFMSGLQLDPHGKVVGVKTNFHVNPSGLVSCRPCAAIYTAEYRRTRRGSDAK